MTHVDSLTLEKQKLRFSTFQLRDKNIEITNVDNYIGK